MNRTWLVTTLVAFLIAGSAVTSQAVTIWTVDAGGGGDFTTIAAAVGAAVDGDTIDILSNITENNITISNKDLTIRGQGANVTTVQAAAARGTAGQRIFKLTGTATMTFQDLTLKHGDATTGGIWADGGAIGIGRWQNINLAIERVAFVDNDASSDGGGISHARQTSDAMSLTIVDSTFSGNRAADGIGAAVHAEELGTGTIRNSTFSDNTSLHSGYWLYGGAVSMVPASGLVQNSTFVGNTLQGFGGPTTHQGGAAMFGSPGVTVESSVFDDNVGLGRGIVNLEWSGSKGTIISSLSEGDILTWTADGGGNLQNALDAGVGSLADNGGPTLTHSLLDGSPAIDAGSNPASLTYDQRGAGYNRVVNGVTDMGAYEVQAQPDVIPEPATMALLGLGWLAMAGVAARRRKRG